MSRPWRIAVPILLTAANLLAQVEPPAGVRELFRVIVEALANQDTAKFLEQFDPAMPGYANLRFDIGGLLGVQGAAATVEFLNDRAEANEGNERRVVRLNWLLRSGTSRPKQEVVTCTVELRDGRWRITALEPIRFFQME